MTARRGTMTFSILLKKVEGEYVAHCLELDIVTTHSDIDRVKEDIVDLIRAQVDYAFSNNNLEYLYRPAPQEVWEVFWRCEREKEDTYPMSSSISESKERILSVPPWITAKTCFA